jgi:hypothetical protein
LMRSHGLDERDGRALRRGFEQGEQNRLRRGLYISSRSWQELDDDAQYRARIQAVMISRRTSPVLSHASAAHMWRLPRLGPWPAEVHLTVRGSTTRESKLGIVWHHDLISYDEVVRIDGMLVTSLLRTLVDIARGAPYIDAVVALDAGLHRPFLLPGGSQDHAVAREQLVEAVHNLGSSRGCRGARAAVSFADGREDIVDFFWEARHTRQLMPLLGEFDGKVKYTRAEYTRGLPIEEVVWAEKIREDRLRGPGRSMVRWLWRTALSPERLRATLLDAGLRPER